VPSLVCDGFAAHYRAQHQSKTCAERLRNYGGHIGGTKGIGNISTLRHRPPTAAARRLLVKRQLPRRPAFKIRRLRSSLLYLLDRVSGIFPAPLNNIQIFVQTEPLDHVILVSENTLPVTVALSGKLTIIVKASLNHPRAAGRLKADMSMTIAAN
jgi:hypothetical protein